MTPEIEKRIKTVQAGRVPAGYKKSKVGIVPKEWGEVRFHDMFSRVVRKNKEGNTNVLTISAQYGLINQNDFFNKTVASDDKSNYYLMKKGEFAYNKSYSNGYPFGALKRLDFYDKGIVSPLYICFAANENNKCPDFYVHYFEAGLMNGEIQAFAQEGARNHGLLNISVDDFFNSNLLNPPLSEQKKIAEILATQDRVIELKEKLIAEKQSQKKYLMSVFFDERKEVTKKTQWTAIRIEDIFDENCEKNYPNAEVLTILQGVGTVPREQSGREIIYDKSALSTYKFVKKGDFIIHLRSFEGGLEAANSDGIVSPAYIILRPKIDVSTKYLYALFHTNRFINQTMAPSVEGARDGRSVKYEVLKKQKINLPSLSEQKAVADVLSAVDEEISLLQKDLEQEKLKKKSLMQLLLTGLVRVA